MSRLYNFGSFTSFILRFLCTHLPYNLKYNFTILYKGDFLLADGLKIRVLLSIGYHYYFNGLH